MSDDTYRLFTATINYFATGEGLSLYFLAVGANSPEDAKDRMNRELGVDRYFLSGADVYDGMPPEKDNVAAFLLSESVKKFLAKQADKLDAHVAVRLYHHFNMS